MLAGAWPSSRGPGPEMDLMDDEDRQREEHSMAASGSLHGQTSPPCKLTVSIGHDDVGALPPQLQGHPLEVTAPRSNLD